MYINKFLKSAVEHAIFKRVLTVSLVVAGLLVAFNHGEKFLSNNLESVMGANFLLTYCVPFCVSEQESVSTVLKSRFN
ncbi:nitrate/nitrite transporter NrtS [Vibrio hannami]|uniref:nitrate/nitrite transporter NrtS n=1 Tax=Vibrio hannami TaxID=2717094 RepID=UPI00241051D9|nr:nitrate/nitrite transporter NrtS [Vibrio hannami]MDG3085071.1 nitrate/nitrite transporter NrtS [Vibrio hannami]